jgi:hypothetical protein
MLHIDLEAEIEIDSNGNNFSFFLLFFQEKKTVTEIDGNFCLGVASSLFTIIRDCSHSCMTHTSYDRKGPVGYNRYSDTLQLTVEEHPKRTAHIDFL